MALLLLFSLEFFYALNNFNPVKAQLDVEIPFQICISHVVYDLAINTDFLYKLSHKTLTECFAVLGQLKLVRQPVSDVLGVPLFVRLFFFHILN